MYAANAATPHAIDPPVDARRVVFNVVGIDQIVGGHDPCRGEQGDDGGEHREESGDEERPLELGVVEDQLAEDRADADTGEHSHREAARALDTTLARRQVGDRFRSPAASTRSGTSPRPLDDGVPT